MSAILPYVPTFAAGAVTVMASIKLMSDVYKTANIYNKSPRKYVFKTLTTSAILAGGIGVASYLLGVSIIGSLALASSSYILSTLGLRFSRMTHAVANKKVFRLVQLPYFYNLLRKGWIYDQEQVSKLNSHGRAQRTAIV